MLCKERYMTLPNLKCKENGEVRKKESGKRNQYTVNT